VPLIHIDNSDRDKRCIRTNSNIHRFDFHSTYSVAIMAQGRMKKENRRSRRKSSPPRQRRTFLDTPSPPKKRRADVNTDLVPPWLFRLIARQLSPVAEASSEGRQKFYYCPRSKAEWSFPVPGCRALFFMFLGIVLRPKQIKVRNHSERWVPPFSAQPLVLDNQDSRLTPRV
jgi:hypothetical protein